MSEKIPFVDRFGDAFKAATLAEPDARPARQRLRRFTHGWRLFAVVAVLLVGGGGALAATSLLSVDTGHYVTSPLPAAGYGGEILNIGAHNALAVGMRDTRDVPFAPGYSAWHRGVVQRNLADPSGQGPVGAAVTSTGALHAWIVSAATCSWAHYWLASMKAGNRAEAATAARHIEQAPAQLSEQAIGDIGPSGLAPAIDAIRAGDVKLVQAMIDVGGMIGYGECSVLGPPAVIPAGMSYQQYQAKKAASRQIGMPMLLNDPATLRINDQVMHSAQMGAALGRVLQQADPRLAAMLARQALTHDGPLATRIGEQLMRDHPVRFYLPRSTSLTGSAQPTRVGAHEVAAIAVGAELLGIPTKDLPKTLMAWPSNTEKVRVAFRLSMQFFVVDPLAEPLDLKTSTS
jgi:hypothetical protein